MKVILSRKGFDSSCAEIPSPIMPNDDLISMPIPSKDTVEYNELIYEDDGVSYWDIITDLDEDFFSKYCHLDPDINYFNGRNEKIKKWRAAFGQANSSAQYLINTVKVEPGDIFLFFGNFHRVKRIDGEYYFEKNTGDFYKDNDLQIIFGYLQVGEILRDPEEIEKYSWHPHACMKMLSKKTNTLFVASDTLSFDPSKKGYGTFNYDKKRILTAEGATKANWKQEKAYDVDNIIGNRKNSSRKGHIFYAGIWQELGLKDNQYTQDWLKKIF